jgi:hypothetical protein
VTYADLAKAIDHVAWRVQSLGVAAGATAVIGTADLYRHIVVALALARIGVTHAPPLLPAHKADIAFLDAGAAAGEFARVVTIEELGQPSRRDDASQLKNVHGCRGTHNRDGIVALRQGISGRSSNTRRRRPESVGTFERVVSVCLPGLGTGVQVIFACDREHSERSKGSRSSDRQGDERSGD